jgi:uncharacterized glyoxalase superfamily protein PhnB
MDWLISAFGAVERRRMKDAKGIVVHGELAFGDGLVFVATPTPDYQGPKKHAESCPSARKWLSVPWVIDGVLVHVDDVDAHYRRAKAAGATILSEPEDGPPARRYRVADCEGHRWMFMARS